MELNITELISIAIHMLLRITNDIEQIKDILNSNLKAIESTITKMSLTVEIECYIDEMGE